MEFLEVKATKKFGEKIASLITPSKKVLCLIGELGSGKTVFVKGLAKGLGIKEVVNSPTFNIMQLYYSSRTKPRRRLYHIDCYRLRKTQDILKLGFKEWLKDKEGVIVIEWADKIKDILPRKRVEIKFTVTGNQRRRVTVKGI